MSGLHLKARRVDRFILCKVARRRPAGKNVVTLVPFQMEQNQNRADGEADAGDDLP